ncbi:2,3-dihydro-2,3-dihydroxybenzoate dehydrogenase [Prauserella rugosa]|uniref:2,3-dihydro-2,3-dihydroxybenzoate dehydrogenase n=1 Tax=Prauserella rugosa TaxID=43354 RepID=A0A660CMQ4_9PSEU|nr:2,3-dihydro-2,3-dihydroxybenzoate dehydrogenase [Prauserella rugosa]KMS90067.1 2,3-dihydroxybenzoate-2,3-dehydrogenase [Streptomyces regensis]TWH22395.1 2,3-dihydro-2,3-dihydroxybenzoate dehydrogenase [Prauserella rugosa]
MEQQEFAGKIAFVTGAAQGIGAAVTHALRNAGATVVATDRNPRIAEAYAGIDGVTAIPCDVTDSARVDEVVAQAEDAVGPIDVLANVAGVLAKGPVESYSDSDWRFTFAVNTDGVFHVSRAVARHMVPRARGSIVTVSSNASGVPRRGMAAYAASKAAATMFTKSLGLELADHGIRCNVVCPGSTDTPMQRTMWEQDGGGPDPILKGDPENYRVGIPLRRIADPSDVADAVLYLASDRARQVTMQELYVDGGATLK